MILESSLKVCIYYEFEILSPLLSIEVKQWLPPEETSDFRFREALEATLKEKSEGYRKS